MDKNLSDKEKVQKIIRSELKKSTGAFPYPIIFNESGGFLYLTCRELNIIEHINAEAVHKTETFLEIAKAFSRIELKIKAKLKDMDITNFKKPKKNLIRNAVTNRKTTKIRFNEAAEILNINVRTLRRMCDRGEIPHHKTPNGTRYFLEKEVKEYLPRD